MIGELPQKLKVGNRCYKIRTDFRDILKILIASNDPELLDEEKIYICLFILYQDFDTMPQELYSKAYEQASWFIDNGTRKEQKKQVKVIDWEQDAPILFPAINKVAGFEVRRQNYMHWWTFLGYFMEMSEGAYPHILALRMKKSKGKKLDKTELEYWNANLDICRLTTKLSEEEQEKKDKLNAMLN